MIINKTSNRNKLFIYFIFLFSFLLRIIYLFIFPQIIFPDSITYIDSGNQLFKYGQIKFDNVMPLYPIWTYIFKTRLNIQIADIFISSMNVILVFILSNILFNSIKIAKISAVISSVYPFFIFYSTTILTENLYITFVLLIFIFFYLDKYFLLVLTIIFSILLRPILDFFALPFLVIFLKLIHKYTWSKIIKLSFIYVLTYTLIMSFWWVHQFKKYNQFVRLNLGDGIVFYSGNNPLNKSGGGAIDLVKGPDMDIQKFINIKDPILKNKLMKKEAFEFIKKNPYAFIKMMYIKFLRFWRLWPYTSSFEKPFYILLSILSYGVSLFFSMFFIFYLKKNELIKLSPILFFIVYLTLIHVVTIASIRYRIPIEPFLIIFSSKFFYDRFFTNNYFEKINLNLF